MEEANAASAAAAEAETALPPVFARGLPPTLGLKVGARARLQVDIKVDPVQPNTKVKKLLSKVSDTISNPLFVYSQVTWFRSDARLTPGQGESQLRFAQGSVHKSDPSELVTHYLDISEVHTEDEGRWICLAENFNGRNSSHTTVAVNGTTRHFIIISPPNL